MNDAPSAPLLLLLADDEASATALETALAWARDLHAEVVGVHLLPLWAAPIADVPMADAVSQQEFNAVARQRGEAVLAAAARQAALAGVRWRDVLRPGQAAAQLLCDLARDLRCRCIVVGTGSHNAVWRLLGGDPVPGLISHAPVPVLVCKP